MHESKRKNEKEFLIWGTGTPLREFMYAEDLANAIEFLLDKDLDSDLINIGSGMEISIKNVSELIKKVVGFEGEILFDPSKPDGNPRKLLDSSQINSLGWSAKVNLNQGLKTTYEWFLNNN